MASWKAEYAVFSEEKQSVSRLPKVKAACSRVDIKLCYPRKKSQTSFPHLKTEQITAALMQESLVNCRQACKWLKASQAVIPPSKLSSIPSTLGFTLSSSSLVFPTGLQLAVPCLDKTHKTKIGIYVALRRVFQVTKAWKKCAILVHKSVQFYCNSETQVT